MSRQARRALEYARCRLPYSRWRSSVAALDGFGRRSMPDIRLIVFRDRPWRDVPPIAYSTLASFGDGRLDVAYATVHP